MPLTLTEAAVVTGVIDEILIVPMVMPPLTCTSALGANQTGIPVTDTDVWVVTGTTPETVTGTMPTIVTVAPVARVTICVPRIVTMVETADTPVTPETAMTVPSCAETMMV
jgi:hypothetical protein